MLLDILALQPFVDFRSATPGILNPGILTPRSNPVLESLAEVTTAKCFQDLVENLCHVWWTLRRI